MEGRVGSTLLMQLLATDPDVVCDRRYPVGEYRYLAYCARVAGWMGTPFEPSRHVGVTEMLFGPPDRGGPLPWTPESLSIETLRPRALRALWEACSEGFRERQPAARWYAEKLACPVDSIVEAGIPLRVIDVVRDPRDVVASMIAFGERSGPWGFGRRPGETDDEWLDALMQTFAARLDAMSAPPRVPTIRMRYEDFAPDLPAAAVMLGDELGLVLDADAVLRRRAEYADHVTTASVDASIGRWRRDLDRALADRLWSALGARLALLGYEEQR